MAASPIDRYIAAARRVGCPPDQISNFIRAGVVLQERQLEAAAAARLCDAPGGPIEIGYGGARGGGKSHYGIAQLFDDCWRFPGLKALVLRKVGKANKENFEDLRGKVLGGVPNEYNRSEGVLYFANGSKIVTGHFQSDRDIDQYLGIEYDVILVEEATTLTFNKYRDIQTCCRSSKVGWRARMYSTTNPGGVGHAWYKKRFIDPHRRGSGYVPLHEQRGETRFVSATSDDNAFLGDDYRRLILDRLTGWKLRAWRYGDWDIAAGQYFITYRRDLHVGEPPRPIPANWRVWASLDYGFTHYTTVYLFAKGDGMLYIADEHAARQWLVPRHVDAIQAMLGRNGVRLEQLKSFVAGADVFARKHTGNTIADEYKAHGITLKTANNDRISGASEFLSRLGDSDSQPGIAPRILISERCAGLNETLPLLEHDPGRPEDVLKWDTDEDGNGGDDYYDGARYGVMEDGPDRTAKSASIEGLWTRR